MVPDVGGRLLRYRNTAQHEEALTSSPTTQKAKRLASKVSVSAFDSQVGYVTVDVEEVIAEATAARCDSPCCGGDRRTPEERDAQRERRRVGYENAARLLGEAEDAANDGEAEKARALVEIANAWDGTRY